MAPPPAPIGWKPDGSISYPIFVFCFTLFFSVSSYSLAQKEKSKEIDFVQCVEPVAVRFLVLVVAMEINIGLCRLLQGRWADEATLQLSVIGSAGYQKLADDTWPHTGRLPFLIGREEK